MATRAKPPMWRWNPISLPRDEHTGEVSRAIMSKATRTGRPGVYGEEMELYFFCDVGKKRWTAVVLVNDIIRRGDVNYKLGLQEVVEMTWSLHKSGNGIIYPHHGFRFAQELVAAEEEGQTHLRIQLGRRYRMGHRRGAKSFTGHWNIRGVGAAVKWLLLECG